MLNNYVGEAGVRGKIFEKLDEGIQSAR
jgi:hypothetical protein